MGWSAVAGGAGRWARAAAPRAKDDRPNIVLIMADDMGYSDIGCYGGEIATPNLDAMARDGLRFTQFYNGAKCGPTRAALLTGLYAQQVGNGKLADCVTIGEVLREAGYRTLMTGKWHSSGLPVERGFDRYFGLTDGCCNFFNPGVQRPGEKPPGKKWKRARRWAIDEKRYVPYTPKDPNFYTTDAFTDYAVKYLDQYAKEDKPFLLHVCYTAPHYPLHAWPSDIAKYRGRYKIGWAELRKRRYARMVKMGLIDPATGGLSAQEPGVPDWDTIEEKDAWDLKMAVYAAMIDRMDQGIGRIMAKIRQVGKERNTLVLFLSDNGGCAENVNTTPDVPPGPMEGYRTLGPEWANASNTPFRKYKTWDHEGGIATPLVAYWPAGIAKPGSITHQVGHIIDLMATCVDLGKAAYPTSYAGHKVLPLEGKSLAPILKGKTRDGHELLFWQYGGSKAVRKGKWKLVSGRTTDGWELYDLAADRTERHNLAARHPQLVAELSAQFAAWKARCAPARGS